MMISPPGLVAPLRSRRHVWLKFVIACFIATVASGAWGQVLWYGGDGDGTGGLINNTHTLDGSTHETVLDDFIVPIGMRFHVTAVFSNNVRDGPSSNPLFRQAEWSIRTGVGPGNFGQVLYGGVSSVSVTPTGRITIGPEYTALVSGLSIVLDPGVYFLSVSPITPTRPEYYVPLSNGANSVGIAGPSPVFQEGRFVSGSPDHLTPIPGRAASMGVIGEAVQASGKAVPTLSTFGYVLLAAAVALLGIGMLNKSP